MARAALHRLGRLRASAADQLLGAAAGQWQADRPRQAPGGEPPRLPWPLLPPAPADRGLDVRGDAQLRLVGLCRLPADLLHRGGAGRQGGRHRAVDHQCAALCSPCAEPAGPEVVGPTVGPLRLRDLRGAVPVGGAAVGAALGDGRADDGGFGLPRHAGRGGRAAVPDVGQALGADRDVGGLFQLPRCLLDSDAGGGLAGALGGRRCPASSLRQAWGFWRPGRWRGSCTQGWACCGPRAGACPPRPRSCRA